MQMGNHAKAALRSCLKCGYNLAGLSHDTCPECGTPFDLEIAARKRRRRQSIASAIVLTIVYYGPYAWLVISPWPWTDHRWWWIQSWLAMPMALVLHLFHQRLQLDMNPMMAILIGSVASVALLWALIRLASRRWWALTLIACVLLLLSILNSIGLHNAFSM